MATIPGNLVVTGNSLLQGYLQVQQTTLLEKNTQIGKSGSSANLYVVGNIKSNGLLCVDELIEYQSNQGVKIENVQFENDRICRDNCVPLLSINNQDFLSIDCPKNNVCLSNITMSGVTGTKNVMLGMNNMENFTSAKHNIAIGIESLKSLTTGNNSIAIGPNTLKTNSTGGNNIAIGCDAMAAAVSSNNIAIGHVAGKIISTGQDNVLFGANCAEELLGGNENVMIGSQSGANSINANKNIVIGYEASANDYDECVILGHSASASANNQLVIGSSNSAITTTTSALAGTNGALPAQVDGYLSVNLNGNIVKIPYYV